MTLNHLPFGTLEWCIALDLQYKALSNLRDCARDDTHSPAAVIVPLGQAMGKIEDVMRYLGVWCETCMGLDRRTSEHSPCDGDTWFLSQYIYTEMYGSPSAWSEAHA